MPSNRLIESDKGEESGYQNPNYTGISDVDFRDPSGAPAWESYWKTDGGAGPGGGFNPTKGTLANLWDMARDPVWFASGNEQNGAEKTAALAYNSFLSTISAGYLEGRHLTAPENATLRSFAQALGTMAGFAAMLGGPTKLLQFLKVPKWAHTVVTGGVYGFGKKTGYGADGFMSHDDIAARFKGAVMDGGMFAGFQMGSKAMGAALSATAPGRAAIARAPGTMGAIQHGAPFGAFETGMGLAEGKDIGESLAQGLGGFMGAAGFGAYGGRKGAQLAEGAKPTLDAVREGPYEGLQEQMGRDRTALEPEALLKQLELVKQYQEAADMQMQREPFPQSPMGTTRDFSDVTAGGRRFQGPRELPPSSIRPGGEEFTGPMDNRSVEPVDMLGNAEPGIGGPVERLDPTDRTRWSQDEISKGNYEPQTYKPTPDKAAPPGQPTVHRPPEFSHWRSVADDLLNGFKGTFREKVVKTRNTLRKRIEADASSWEFTQDPARWTDEILRKEIDALLTAEELEGNIANIEYEATDTATDATGSRKSEFQIGQGDRQTEGTIKSIRSEVEGDSIDILSEYKSKRKANKQVETEPGKSRIDEPRPGEAPWITKEVQDRMEILEKQGWDEYNAKRQALFGELVDKGAELHGSETLDELSEFYDWYVLNHVPRSKKLMGWKVREGDMERSPSEPGSLKDWADYAAGDPLPYELPKEKAAKGYSKRFQATVTSDGSGREALAEQEATQPAKSTLKVGIKEPAPKEAVVPEAEPAGTKQDVIDQRWKEDTAKKGAGKDAKAKVKEIKARAKELYQDMAKKQPKAPKDELKLSALELAKAEGYGSESELAIESRQTEADSAKQEELRLKGRVDNLEGQLAEAKRQKALYDGVPAEERPEFVGPRLDEAREYELQEDRESRKAEVEAEDLEDTGDTSDEAFTTATTKKKVKHAMGYSTINDMVNAIWNAPAGESGKIAHDLLVHMQDLKLWPTKELHKVYAALLAPEHHPTKGRGRDEAVVGTRPDDYLSSAMLEGRGEERIDFDRQERLPEEFVPEEEGVGRLPETEGPSGYSYGDNKQPLTIDYTNIGDPRVVSQSPTNWEPTQVLYDPTTGELNYLLHPSRLTKSGAKGAYVPIPYKSTTGSKSERAAWVTVRIDKSGFLLGDSPVRAVPIGEMRNWKNLGRRDVAMEGRIMEAAMGEINKSMHKQLLNPEVITIGRGKDATLRASKTTSDLMTPLTKAEAKRKLADFGRDLKAAETLDAWNEIRARFGLLPKDTLPKLKKDRATLNAGEIKKVVGVPGEGGVPSPRELSVDEYMDMIDTGATRAIGELEGFTPRMEDRPAPVDRGTGFKAPFQTPDRIRDQDLYEKNPLLEQDRRQMERGEFPGLTEKGFQRGKKILTKEGLEQLPPEEQTADWDTFLRENVKKKERLETIDKEVRKDTTPEVRRELKEKFNVHQEAEFNEMATELKDVFSEKGEHLTEEQISDLVLDAMVEGKIPPELDSYMKNRC